MAKDLSMMLLQCIVPTARMHEVDAKLESVMAREVMWRPYRNGASAPADGTSTVARSEAQQAWLSKHVKGDMKAIDIRKAWTAAGFMEANIYQALGRAVQSKILKKVKPGIYRGV